LFYGHCLEIGVVFVVSIISVAIVIVVVIVVVVVVVGVVIIALWIVNRHLQQIIIRVHIHVTRKVGATQMTGIA
jgi:hypothetical protein